MQFYFVNIDQYVLSLVEISVVVLEQSTLVFSNCITVFQIFQEFDYIWSTGRPNLSKSPISRNDTHYEVLKIHVIRPKMDIWCFIT